MMTTAMEATGLRVTMEQMQARLVRYADLEPCRTAFIDAKTPGSDQKENFCIIGPGVAEAPGQHVHVRIPHGFNIGGARQPKGCVNSQHSHVTEEVFLVHSGEWAFRWGHDGTDGEAVLSAGDVISLPVNVFRGFECLSDGDSFLFSILGGDDPGHVTWAPYVFEMARDHGLVLTAGGRLIDTTIGETVPDGDEPCTPTSMADVASFRRMTADEMGACVVRASDEPPAMTSLAERSAGLREAPILGPANEAESVPAAPVAHKHGFHFRRLTMSRSGAAPLHSRDEVEVLFVHRGAMDLEWADGELTLEAGDTITLPIRLARAWRARGDGALIYVVRGGDAPTAPNWRI